MRARLTVMRARTAVAADNVEALIMEWLSQNWVWVLLGLGFIAMPMFGLGGHGGGDEKKPAGKDGK